MCVKCSAPENSKDKKPEWKEEYKNKQSERHNFRLFSAKNVLGGMNIVGKLYFLFLVVLSAPRKP